MLTESRFLYLTVFQPTRGVPPKFERSFYHLARMAPQQFNFDIINYIQYGCCQVGVICNSLAAVWDVIMMGNQEILASGKV